MDRELKKILDQYQPECRRESVLEETVEKACQLYFHPEEVRIGGGTFFINQLRFIRPHTWLLKAGLALLLILILPGSTGWTDMWLWTFVSMTGPLLCLVNANELWESCCPGMMEILLAAKHSVRQVVLVRLILFGLIDAVVFIVSALTMTASGQGAAWQLLLYGTVPYLGMCAGCMAVLTRCREENAMAWCAGWAGMLTLFFVMPQSVGADVYGLDAVSVWLLLGAAALAATVWQTVKFMKKSGGIADEINTGAAV